MLTSTTFRTMRPALSSASRSFSTTPRSALARMTLIGRLAAEPELVNTSTGREMVRYAMGVSSGPRDNPQTSWYRIACFDEGPRRDYVLGLPKGTLMHCEANASMSTYDDAEGKKRTALNLVQST
ncbi:hypothetical protein NA57DRAFT_47335 [Rhizodiscina lignyota]|uniref:SsDNA binding protein n=1 Tax=Rhizodiscina lignyota TaxID=1504668 RepID=A0A9P4I912_9PEZI|nr:hypothetical protein NA57DRAFT_47335 [Rhizodiscina lignyota]